MNVQANKSCEIGIGEIGIGIPRKKGTLERVSATLLLSPGIYLLASRGLAQIRISYFASFLYPLKWVKHGRGTCSCSSSCL